MMDWVAAEKHAFTAKMEFVPGFYRIYSYCFLKIMRTSDLWESTQEHDKTHFSASITKCLWHTACQENGCPELCPLFCDVDDVTYGGLRKLGFSRTKTLGCGGDCCDFRFFKGRRADGEADFGRIFGAAAESVRSAPSPTQCGRRWF